MSLRTRSTHIIRWILEKITEFWEALKKKLNGPEDNNDSDEAEAKEVLLVAEENEDNAPPSKKPRFDI